MAKLEIRIFYFVRKFEHVSKNPLKLLISRGLNVVGVNGLEPSTPTMSRWCSNQLSYTPKSGAIIAGFDKMASTFLIFMLDAYPNTMP